MGLDSVEFRDTRRMDTIEQLGLVLAESICGAPIIGQEGLLSGIQALPESPKHSYLNAPATANLFDFSSLQGCSQLQVLLQAQALLKTSEAYLKLDEAMHQVQYFRTNLQTLLNKNDNDSMEEEELVGVLHRDTAVSNLRFLNIFFGYSPQCYAMAVNLLDRLLSRVKTHPRYLSCVATSCFFIAAKVMEDRKYLPTPQELVKLSQCGGTAQDLMRMERLIIEKIQYQVQSVNSLTFMQYFCELLACKDPRFEDHGFICRLIAKLEVLQCQFEFSKYKAETLALALLSCVVQETDVMGNMEVVTSLFEVQEYCQISDEELIQCRSLVADCLNMYRNQRSKLPRLRLVWTVSRRTLNKMKPSTRILLDLEPIFEDEDDETEESSDDSGPFDSESELERHIREAFAIKKNVATTTTTDTIKAVSGEEAAQASTEAGNDGNNNVQDNDEYDSFCCSAAAAAGDPCEDDHGVAGSESFIKVHSNAAEDDDTAAAVDGVIDSNDM